MLKRCFASSLLFALLQLLGATASFATRDVSILYVEPGPDQRTPINIPTPIRVNVANQGDELAQNIGVRVRIIDSFGVVYDDSVTIASLTAGATITAHLDAFTPTSHGLRTVYAQVSLPGDEEPGDNFYEGENWVGYEYDAAAVAVVEPGLDAVKLQKIRFDIRGTFKAFWQDHYDVPVRVVIRRCSDNLVVFQADTIVEVLEGKSAITSQVFPNVKGTYDTRKLAPGCYTIAMIARYPTDGDRTNDTVYSEFTVAPNKLLYDVAVDSLSGPNLKDPIDPGKPLAITFSYLNVGQMTVGGVKVYTDVRDGSNTLIYRDSTVLGNWTSGLKLTRSFKSFSPTYPGNYRLITYTTLATDEYRDDDTVRRSFSVNGPATPVTVTILKPLDNEVLSLGSGFFPIAHFALSPGFGSIPNGMARFEIEGPRDLAIEYQLTWLGGDDARDLTFPNTDGNMSTADLPKGRYSAVAHAPNELAKSDTIQFRIAHEHDVAIEGLVAPAQRELNPVGPLNIKVSAANIGIQNETQVWMELEILNSAGEVVHMRTVSAPIAAEGSFIFDLGDFTPAREGLYYLSATAVLDNETDKSDNVLETTLHFGTSLYAVAVVSPVVPLEGEIIAAGTEFNPTAVVEWLGANETVRSTRFKVRIFGCGSDVFEFQTEEIVSPDGIEELSLPGDISGSSIKDLFPGCYKAVFTVSHPMDEDPSDDTLVVNFTLRDPSTVSSEIVDGFTIDRFTVAVNRLSVSLTGSQHASSWQIFDLLGREVLSGAELSAIMTIDLQALPSGGYVFVVRGNTSSASASRKFELTR